MKYNYCKQITNGVELHPVECLPGEMYDWAKVKFRHVRICITHVGQTPWLQYSYADKRLVLCILPFLHSSTIIKRQ